MNRYRTVPGLGPQRAAASTVCQKCLQKGHYSYECKGSLQERPYKSRPSRSQQFNNPKLTPRLTNDAPNELLIRKGIADQQLADAEASRQLPEDLEHPPSPRAERGRTRSRSVSSVDSVSTISTNKSKSPLTLSHSKSARQLPHHRSKSRSRSRSQSRSHSRGHKRRYQSISTSPRPRSSPPRTKPSRKNRRHRTRSPDDRGRHSFVRRGSHRSRSRSHDSGDKSRVTKQRRSLDEDTESPARMNVRDGPSASQYRSRFDSQNHSNSNGQSPRRAPNTKRERSLSPYSRRLALTQAMNMS